MTSFAGARSGTKPRRSYHHGDLRQALIDAALEQIAEGDVGAVSLRALARRVGVTYAAPYHHFEDKNALLAAVAAEGFRKMGDEMDREIGALPPGATARDRLAAQGRAYVQFAVQFPSHYRVMFRHDLADPAVYTEMQEAGSRCFDRLVGTVQEILEEPEPNRRVLSQAVAAWASVHGVASLWNEGPLRYKAPDVPVEVLTGWVIETLGRAIG